MINKDRHILNIYGISQDPKTKNYIMVLEYAKYGNFNNWINRNHKNFSWNAKLSVLYNIFCGLQNIHQNGMVHRDFHTGNILLRDITFPYISDMGLCGEVGNIDETKIYGVMPYVAPEVLKGKPYTQAADIYSFGMIMYFVATGKQPFSDRAHDQYLVLSIYNGIRPKINEPEAPECYIDLMKKCWDSNPENRPNASEISDLLWSFIKINHSHEIEMQIEKAEEYRIANLENNDNKSTTHLQAIYTSRLLNPFTENLPKYDDNMGNDSVEITDFTKFC